MTDTHRLGDLQLAILDVLWETGEATVADVHAALHSDRGLATTTIATMLRRLEEKGVVGHRAHGRQFVYRPLHARDDVHRSMVGDLIARLFAGDPAELVHHLVREGEIELADLDALRRRVAAHKRRLPGGGRG